MDALEKNTDDSLKPQSSFKEEERPSSPTLDTKSALGSNHNTGTTGTTAANDKVSFCFSDKNAVSLQWFESVVITYV